MHAAFVDPHDPSVVYLTQPVDESQRLREAPRWVVLDRQVPE
jgi:hypothetical protein